LLALCGGAVGLVLSVWCNNLLLHSLGGLLGSINFSFVVDLAPDAAVLSVTFLFCLIATILFSLGPALPRPAPLAEPRAAILPDAEPATSVDDIGRAIAGWSNDELERLRVMVTSELRRRGLLRVESAHAPPSAAEAKAKGAAGQAARQRRHGASVQEVAPGQASAIRAASQAGMGLGKIAREFGLPLATVRRVLSALAPTGST